MKYFKENKVLLEKYLLIIIFNIILYILNSFYLKNSDIGTIVMLILVFIFDMFIYYYKGTVTFKYYLDIICNILVGLLLTIIIDDYYIYSTNILSLFISNNIVFARSRLSNKFFKRSLQYMLIFLITILCMIINLSLISIFK